ncbi:LysE family translocator [Azospirillum griseum]|uniref:LysE family translocator n=1 Tax=Azospirillum griseum TaxID=2496639 RepID=A0A431VIB4_9PROT|nr:LysE family translocator [Azospirillum griseum]RTR21085.1 LysE family translocator [Azospirillum griseum]
MGFDQVLLLASACFVAMASPGPGVFAVVSRSLAIGYRRNMPFIGGMVLGDLVLLGLAMSGLAAVASVLGDAFRILTYLAAGYLVYLGIGCWRHAADPAVLPSSSNARGFASGVAITLSNPKTILFYMAFLPAFVDLFHLTLPDTMLVALVVGAVLFGVMTSYSIASASARALFRSPRALLILNRCAACLMVGTGLLIALR